jgi:NADH-quinone oxidoreductase subunit J
MNLTGEFVAFFVLSVMAIGGAVFMISFTRVVHMALALAFTFFSLAGIYLMLDAEFVAVIQVLIYTGAVTILMLFGIMLTKQRDDDRTAVGPWHGTVSFLAVAAFFGLVMWVVYKTPVAGQEADVKQFTVAKLGESVFKQYIIPFELASVLLLAALVGAVILARREER